MMELKVNFDPTVIQIFKEVRNFNWLNIKVPITIKIKGDEIKLIYPFAMSLQESLSSYSRSCSKLDSNLIKLVANQRRDIQKEVQSGMELSWQMGTALERFTKKIVGLIQAFEDSVSELLTKADMISTDIEDMNQCEVSEISNKLKAIQKHVDDLNLQNYCNLEQWVQIIDSRIEEILLSRT